jgi:hypothetical protein
MPHLYMEKNLNLFGLFSQLREETSNFFVLKSWGHSFSNFICSISPFQQ